MVSATVTRTSSSGAARRAIAVLLDTRLIGACLAVALLIL
jgi:hypothetical protein